MGSLVRQVEEAVTTALGRVRPELAGADPLVRRSDRADFQSNVALASAKRVKARPAELAGELAEALHGADGPIADVEVSGPGFLNITVAALMTTEWIANHLVVGDDRPDLVLLPGLSPGDPSRAPAPLSWTTPEPASPGMR